MKHSEMLNLNLPEGNDLINVGHLSGNFEKIDSAFQTLPVKQEESKTDIDVIACPPYWTMHNATDEDIVYIDHNFFDEEFTLEAGQTIVHEIEEPENIRISSDTTIDYVYFIPASEAFSGGGTSDYNKLTNLPSINNVEIKNNKTADDLGLVAKENGKGLSTNDFSNAYKAQLDGLDDALDAKLNANSVGVAGGVAELGNDGKVPSSQLPDPVAQKEYKLVEASAEGYAKSYKLQVKDGESWSDVTGSSVINIPKDMVVESGSVKECTTDNVPVSGYKKGDKYIDLVIANKADAHIYINVKDLADDKASGISYSNATSKLTAETVQAALDEIAALAKGNESAISDINEALEEKVNQTELLSFENDVYNRTGGGKNLLALKTLKESVSKGITFTPVYKDGVIDHVLINGTNDGSGASSLTLISKPNYEWADNIISFECDDSNVKLMVGYYDASWGWKKNQIINSGAEDAITSDYPLKQITIYIASGTTVNNAKAYPMVRLPHIKSSEYVPYIPTNSELNSELKTNILSTIVASSNASATNAKTLEFQGTGKALEQLKIEGKTVQDGTPSPSAPVEVKGVGDKCNNIFNYAKWSDAWSTAQSGTVSKDASGFTLTATANDCYTKTHNVVACLISGYTVGKTYTLSWKANNSIGGNVYVFDGNGNTIKSANNSSAKSITFTATTTSIQLRFGVAASGASIRYYDIKIEEGSTATKFYPYDKRNMYEIPISSGGKSTNIYLNAPLFNGEKADLASGVVEKKYGMYILTGSETFTTTSIDSNLVQYAMDKPSDIVATSGYGQPAAWCSIATRQSSSAMSPNIIGFGNKMGFVVNKSEFASDTAFKERLTTLYNSGNPAVVVYQLATATKETFEAPEIATTVGKNTLSVDTEVTPASISATSFGEYYSKTEVDKLLAALQTNWSISNISTTSSYSMYFEESDNLLQYYDRVHSRVVITLIGTTKKVIPAKTVIGLGSATSQRTTPKGNVSVHYKFTDGSKEYRLTKNGDGDLSVVFSNMGGEIPIGTRIVQQLEYSVLP